MKRALLVISLGAALAGCETVGPVQGPPPPPAPRPSPAPPPSPFREHDFAWSAQHGTSSIRGQVAYGDGATRYSCAGQPVILTPDAPFSRRRIYELYGSIDRAALPVSVVRSRQQNRPSDDYNAFVRRSSCDAQQKFTFQGLPAGSWFVIVVAQPAAAGAEPIALMRRVSTRGGSVRDLTVD